MIAFLIIATGKYDRFLPQLIESIETFVQLPHHTFVFTDSPDSWIGAEKVSIQHKPFPMATLQRYEVFANHTDILAGFDYYYYIDADMRIVAPIGQEILGERVAVIHPGFLGGKGTPERRLKSTAYIAKNEKNTYYAGGFQGGSQYLDICAILAENINKDLSKGIIAVWHDESHWNWYLHHYKPDTILDAGYCYPESWSLDFHRRILALDKNHDEIRRTQEVVGKELG